MITDFSKIKHVHFIGIGGIGISAIARMLMLEGKKVTGSDRDESEVTGELEKIGISVTIGQSEKNVPAKADLVIYTIAITDDNLELMKARKVGIECITYPQALGIISKDKFTIAVAGTHGKTTTTAMIAKMLIDAKMDPTVIVGSFLKDQQSNFIAGKSKYLVVEACEYKRSFLNLYPNILVITNIDDDHLDYYKDIEDIKSAFRELIKKTASDGSIVCDLEMPHIGDVVRSIETTVVDYELFGDMNLALKIPGAHNLSNAAAVLAVADVLGIPRVQAKKSLESFSGTWRRFEYKGSTKKGVKIYDDYGHHPTEIMATLKGTRELFPDKKIIAIFQPHLYSRTKQHLKEFARAFSDVDQVIIAPIYAAREPEDPSISAAILSDQIIMNNGSSVALPSFEAIEKYITDECKKGDIVITMGAGDIYKVGEHLLSK
ncbi:MAG: UDP-N-acetylmuramate--L-alanine ligase [bacterium]|nr:UDP-N-acetylmuramate--L-alanine ligase [bacterium]